MKTLKDSVRIPVALQVVMDDLGWFNGRDDRAGGFPSRTGIPRRHAPEDYLVLNEIGKRINMKFNCPFVIGEWDKDNILRGMPYATRDPENWDNKSKIDMDLAERCFEAAESSEYIEYAIHGLLHGYWGDEWVLDQEFTVPLPGAKHKRLGWYPNANEMVPCNMDYVESHIEAFYKIYDSWGFKKKIRSFTAPSSLFGGLETMQPLADTIKKYGFLYWKNGWSGHYDLQYVINGVIFLNNLEFIPWEAYDVDPTDLPDRYTIRDGQPYDYYAVFSTHWPNFLRYNPKKNMENVDAWVKYFESRAEIFGLMLSRDIAFAGSQAVYYANARLSFPSENRMSIDFAGVDAQNALGLDNTFYLSVLRDRTPVAESGCTCTLYEAHKDFNTYAITRTGKGAAELSF